MKLFGMKKPPVKTTFAYDGKKVTRGVYGNIQYGINVLPSGMFDVLVAFPSAVSYANAMLSEDGMVVNLQLFHKISMMVRSHLMSVFDSRTIPRTVEPYSWIPDGMCVIQFTPGVLDPDGFIDTSEVKKKIANSEIVASEYTKESIKQADERLEKEWGKTERESVLYTVGYVEKLTHRLIDTIFDIQYHQYRNIQYWTCNAVFGFQFAEISFPKEFKESLSSGLKAGTNNKKRSEKNDYVKAISDIVRTEIVGVDEDTKGNPTIRITPGLGLDATGCGIPKDISCCDREMSRKMIESVVDWVCNHHELKGGDKND